MLNYYLAEQIARDRLSEAREMAARGRLIASSPVASDSIRVALGLALIRAGRALAGHAAKGSSRPRRATA
jgi:hypothetical protein